MLAKLVLLLLVFGPCVLVPGFLVVRRFRVPDALRLPLSVAVSVAAMYLAGFALYLAGLGTAAAWTIVAAVLGAAAVHRRELLALLSAPATRVLLVHQAIFAAWLLLLALSIRNYSGGGWSGDWEEHYQRALFFLGKLPLGWRFIDQWVLPARPPLQNVVVAFFLRLAGDDYPSFQLASVLLASLEYLGCAALWTVLSANRTGANLRAGLLVLTALLCLNPSVVENGTYPWTRALTNLFALQAAAFYVVGLREGDVAARRWSFLLLGLAGATHYSMGPYAVALVPVELWLLRRRRVPVREVALALGLGAAAIGPWLVFAVARFGVADTFLSNSTVQMNAALDAGGVVLRTAKNLVTTLVPDVLRDVAPVADEFLPSHIRDAAFLVYQVSLPALMGSLGGAAVGALVVAAAIRRSRRGGREEVAVIGAYVVTVIALGVASFPVDDPYGVAHVCLQPLAVAGVVYLASRWDELARGARWGLAAALGVDAVLGIGFQFFMQSLTAESLSDLDVDAADVSWGLVVGVQHKLRLGQPFLGEVVGAPAVALVVAALVLLVAVAVAAARGARTPAVSRRAEPA